jgi:hypothetical protein
MFQRDIAAAAGGTIVPIGLGSGARLAGEAVLSPSNASRRLSGSSTSLRSFTHQYRAGRAQSPMQFGYRRIEPISFACLRVEHAGAMAGDGAENCSDILF